MNRVEKIIRKIAERDGIRITVRESLNGDSCYFSIIGSTHTVTVRYSDHEQPAGGSYRVDEFGDGRSAFSGINIIGWEAGATAAVVAAIEKSLADESSDEAELLFGAAKAERANRDVAAAADAARKSSEEFDAANKLAAIVAMMSAADRAELLTVYEAMDAVQIDDMPRKSDRRYRLALPTMNRYGVKQYDMSDMVQIIRGEK